MVHEISIRRFTDEYYLALGRFIAAFSEIEGAMQVALWHFSSVKSPVAQAVFSGIRADEASNKITRISNAEGYSPPTQKRYHPLWRGMARRKYMVSLK